MSMKITGNYDNYDDYIKAEKTGTAQGMDSVSKGIQMEIAGRQSELKSLSENGEMSAEEKRKKKQEISQEIEELKNKLRQRQLEKREEDRKKQQDAMGETEQNKKLKAADLTGGSMQAMVAADAGMSQARLQGTVASKMENQAGVLGSEIRQDAARGKETETKEAELAKIEKRAMQAASSQMTALKGTREDMKKAGEDKREKTDNKSIVYKKPENKGMKNIPGVEYKQDGKKANHRFFHSALDIRG